MLCFGMAKPQIVLLLTMRSKGAEKGTEQKIATSLDLTSACEPSALPSELMEDAC